jgi:hypothetical protein
MIPIGAKNPINSGSRPMNEKIGARDPGSNSAANGAPSPQDKRLAEMMAENERLQAEVEQIKRERDDYLKALYRFAPEYMFTAEEIQDMMTNGVSGREVLAMVEAMVKESP